MRVLDTMQAMCIANTGGAYSNFDYAEEANGSHIRKDKAEFCYKEGVPMQIQGDINHTYGQNFKEAVADFYSKGALTINQQISDWKRCRHADH